MSMESQTENKTPAADEIEGPKIEQLLPITETVEVEGETFEIKHFDFFQSIAAKKEFNNIILQLEFAYKKARSTEEIRKNILKLEGEIFNALQGYEEDLIKIIEVATGKDREWIEAISDPREGTALTLAILSVNADFFRRRLNSKGSGSSSAKTKGKKIDVSGQKS